MYKPSTEPFNFTSNTSTRRMKSQIDYQRLETGSDEGDETSLCKHLALLMIARANLTEKQAQETIMEYEDFLPSREECKEILNGKEKNQTEFEAFEKFAKESCQKVLACFQKKNIRNYMDDTLFEKVTSTPYYKETLIELAKEKDDFLILESENNDHESLAESDDDNVDQSMPMSEMLEVMNNLKNELKKTDTDIKTYKEEIEKINEKFKPEEEENTKEFHKYAKRQVDGQSVLAEKECNENYTKAQERKAEISEKKLQETKDLKIKLQSAKLLNKSKLKAMVTLQKKIEVEKRKQKEMAAATEDGGVNVDENIEDNALPTSEVPGKPKFMQIPRSLLKAPDTPVPYKSQLNVSSPEVPSHNDEDTVENAENPVDKEIEQSSDLTNHKGPTNESNENEEELIPTQAKMEVNNSKMEVPPVRQKELLLQYFITGQEVLINQWNMSHKIVKEIGGALHNPVNEERSPFTQEEIQNIQPLKKMRVGEHSYDVMDEYTTRLAKDEKGMLTILSSNLKKLSFHLLIPGLKTCLCKREEIGQNTECPLTLERLFCDLQKTQQYCHKIYPESYGATSLDIHHITSHLEKFCSTQENQYNLEVQKLSREITDLAFQIDYRFNNVSLVKENERFNMMDHLSSILATNDSIMEKLSTTPQFVIMDQSLEPEVQQHAMSIMERYHMYMDPNKNRNMVDAYFTDKEAYTFEKSQATPFVLLSGFSQEIMDLQLHDIDLLKAFVLTLFPMPGMTKSAYLCLSNKTFIEFIVAHTLDQNITTWCTKFISDDFDNTKMKYMKGFLTEHIKELYKQVLELLFPKHVLPLLKLVKEVPRSTYKAARQLLPKEFMVFFTERVPGIMLNSILKHVDYNREEHDIDDYEYGKKPKEQSDIFKALDHVYTNDGKKVLFDVAKKCKNIKSTLNTIYQMNFIWGQIQDNEYSEQHDILDHPTTLLPYIKQFHVNRKEIDYGERDVDNLAHEMVFSDCSDSYKANPEEVLIGLHLFNKVVFKNELIDKDKLPSELREFDNYIRADLLDKDESMSKTSRFPIIWATISKLKRGKADRATSHAKYEQFHYPISKKVNINHDFDINTWSMCNTGKAKPLDLILHGEHLDTVKNLIILEFYCSLSHKLVHCTYEELDRLIRRQNHIQWRDLTLYYPLLPACAKKNSEFLKFKLDTKKKKKKCTDNKYLELYTNIIHIRHECYTNGQSQEVMKILRRKYHHKPKTRGDDTMDPYALFCEEVKSNRKKNPDAPKRGRGRIDRATEKINKDRMLEMYREICKKMDDPSLAKKDVEKDVDDLDDLSGQESDESSNHENSRPSSSSLPSGSKKCRKRKRSHLSVSSGNSELSESENENLLPSAGSSNSDSQRNRKKIRSNGDDSSDDFITTPKTPRREQKDKKKPAKKSSSTSSQMKRKKDYSPTLDSHSYESEPEKNKPKLSRKQSSARSSTSSGKKVEMSVSVSEEEDEPTDTDSDRTSKLNKYDSEDLSDEKEIKTKKVKGNKSLGLTRHRRSVSQTNRK